MKKGLILIFAYVFLTILPVIVHADSDDVTVSATVLGTGGSGGSNGFIQIENITPPTSITFLGQAFLGAHMFVLKDGNNFIATTAGMGGNFSMNYSGLSPGVYVFTVFVESLSGAPYYLGSYTVDLKGGVAIVISGITIPEDILNKILGIEPQIPPSPEICDSTKADINCDGKIDIDDMSILLYWYRLKGYLLKVDLNSDQRVDLGDFSVMAYYWTGQ